MLQKSPINRPSADQLHVKLVPILLKPIQEKEGVLQSTIDIAPSDDENTRYIMYMYVCVYVYSGTFSKRTPLD